MTKQIYPDIGFSRWVPWHERKTLVQRPDAYERDASYPCLYILGQFKDEVTSQTTHTDKQVKYVGWSRNIRDRPIGAHTKQHEYRRKCHDPDLKHLYVAVFDIAQWGLGGNLSPAQVAWLEYMERRLIWEYADAWGEKPELNDKDILRAEKGAKRAAKEKTDKLANEELVARKTADAKARFKAHREG